MIIKLSAIVKHQTDGDKHKVFQDFRSLVPVLASCCQDLEGFKLAWVQHESIHSNLFGGWHMDETNYIFTQSNIPKKVIQKSQLDWMVHVLDLLFMKVNATRPGWHGTIFNYTFHRFKIEFLCWCHGFFAMLEPRKYADWIHGEVFQPVIVVIGTGLAKARIKQANGLSLAELFTPFGVSSRFPLSVSVQSLERSVAIEHFGVQFTDADVAVQLSSLQADQLAAWAVESSALDRSARSHSSNALKAPSPWYEQWRSALFRSLRWSDHEGLDQPAAALLVVMSKESEPAMLMEQLLHSSNMPPLCSQGILDPVPSRVAVLLHDASDPASPSKEELARKVDDLKVRFAPNQVFALEINHGAAKALALLC